MNVGIDSSTSAHEGSASTRFSRRTALIGATRFAAGAAMMAALGSRAFHDVLAQETTSALPELKVTVVDDAATGQAFQASATEIPAGLVLLTAINQSASESSVGLVGPQSGQTMDDLLQLASTPEPGNGFPSFFTQAVVPGGAFVPAGMTAQIVVRLDAGDWAIWGGGEAASPPPVFVTATTGDTNQAEPPASVTVTEVDFAFSGLDASITAGAQTWKVVNTGTQPHMLSISLVPDGTTESQIMAMVNGDPNATPDASALTRDDFKTVGGVLLQSPNTTVWPKLDLSVGHYAALCYMTDPSNGEAHVMAGMVAVFDVVEAVEGAGGTPTT